MLDVQLNDVSFVCVSFPCVHNLLKFNVILLLSRIAMDYCCSHSVIFVSSHYACPIFNTSWMTFSFSG
jgi:hypothetical protein